MDDPERIELVERFFAVVVNRREPGQVGDIVDRNVSIHHGAGPARRGLAALEETVSDLRDQFPGATFTVYRSEVVDEFVVVAWTTEAKGRLGARRIRPERSGGAVFSTSGGRIASIRGLAPHSRYAADEYDDDDDDDGGPVGGRPSGPPWVPPVPRPRPRPTKRPPQEPA